MFLKAKCPQDASDNIQLPCMEREYVQTNRGGVYMALAYEESDINRFSRKMAKLLMQNEGKDFLNILKEKTSITSEFRSVLDLPNSKLEEYMDKALHR